MLKILNGTKQEIKKNIGILAADYKEKTGRIVCTFCPSDVQYMISTLKLFYKMKNFNFTKEFAQYKNAKGDKTTISNATMTDERAIEFLRTNPERISLFNKFPKNWKALIKKGASKESAQTSLIDEISQTEANKIDVIGAENLSPEEEAMKAASEDMKKEEDCCEDDAQEPCEDCIEKKRAELSEMTVKELKLAYPEIKVEKNMRKPALIEAILKV